MSCAQVETPAETRASVRFAKYRGLKSWRTSAWDPREELPPEYARVFAFENFRRAQKRCVSVFATADSFLGSLCCHRCSPATQSASLS